uniref:Uncharacterized protein n=1 Tax=Rhizophora mucronata TaxID=61149 RepID=A0A2P2QEL6_RHIMU
MSDSQNAIFSACPHLFPYFAHFPLWLYPITNTDYWKMLVLVNQLVHMLLNLADNFYI